MKASTLCICSVIVVVGLFAFLKASTLCICSVIDVVVDVVVVVVAAGIVTGLMPTTPGRRTGGTIVPERDPPPGLKGLSQFGVTRCVSGWL